MAVSSVDAVLASNKLKSHSIATDSCELLSQLHAEAVSSPSSALCAKHLSTADNSDIVIDELTSSDVLSNLPAVPAETEETQSVVCSAIDQLDNIAACEAAEHVRSIANGISLLQASCSSAVTGDLIVDRLRDTSLLDNAATESVCMLSDSSKLEASDCCTLVASSECSPCETVNITSIKKSITGNVNSTSCSLSTNSIPQNEAVIFCINNTVGIACSQTDCNADCHCHNAQRPATVRDFNVHILESNRNSVISDERDTCRDCCDEKQNDCVDTDNPTILELASSVAENSADDNISATNEDMLKMHESCTQASVPSAASIAQCNSGPVTSMDQLMDGDGETSDYVTSNEDIMETEHKAAAQLGTESHEADSSNVANECLLLDAGCNCEMDDGREASRTTTTESKCDNISAHSTMKFTGTSSPGVNADVSVDEGPSSRIFVESCANTAEDKSAEELCKIIKNSEIVSGAFPTVDHVNDIACSLHDESEYIDGEACRAVELCSQNNRPGNSSECQTDTKIYEPLIADDTDHQNVESQSSCTGAVVSEELKCDEVLNEHCCRSSVSSSSKSCHTETELRGEIPYVSSCKTCHKMGQNGSSCHCARSPHDDVVNRNEMTVKTKFSSGHFNQIASFVAAEVPAQHGSVADNITPLGKIMQLVAGMGSSLAVAANHEPINSLQNNSSARRFSPLIEQILPMYEGKQSVALDFSPWNTAGYVHRRKEKSGKNRVDADSGNPVILDACQFQPLQCITGVQSKVRRRVKSKADVNTADVELCSKTRKQRRVKKSLKQADCLINGNALCDGAEVALDCSAKKMSDGDNEIPLVSFSHVYRSTQESTNAGKERVVEEESSDVLHDKMLDSPKAATKRRKPANRKVLDKFHNTDRSGTNMAIAAALPIAEMNVLSRVMAQIAECGNAQHTEVKKARNRKKSVNNCITGSGLNEQRNINILLHNVDDLHTSLNSNGSSANVSTNTQPLSSVNVQVTSAPVIDKSLRKCKRKKVSTEESYKTVCCDNVYEEPCDNSDIVSINNQITANCALAVMASSSSIDKESSGHLDQAMPSFAEDKTKVKRRRRSNILKISNDDVLKTDSHSAVIATDSSAALDIGTAKETADVTIQQLVVEGSCLSDIKSKKKGLPKKKSKIEQEVERSVEAITAISTVSEKHASVTGRKFTNRKKELTAEDSVLDLSSGRKTGEYVSCSKESNNNYQAENLLKCSELLSSPVETETDINDAKLTKKKRKQKRNSKSVAFEPSDATEPVASSSSLEREQKNSTNATVETEEELPNCMDSSGIDDHFSRNNKSADEVERTIVCNKEIATEQTSASAQNSRNTDGKKCKKKRGKNKSMLLTPTDCPVTEYCSQTIHEKLSSAEVGGFCQLSKTGGDELVSVLEPAISCDHMFDSSKPFACSICSYKSNKKGQLRKHLNIHQVFACAHCTFIGDSPNSLEEHMANVHPSRCGRRLCKRCHMLFRSDDGAFEHHKHVCTGEKFIWKCSFCGKQFKFVSAMKTHLRRWHSSSTVVSLADIGVTSETEKCELDAGAKEDADEMCKQPKHHLTEISTISSAVDFDKTTCAKAVKDAAAEEMSIATSNLAATSVERQRHKCPHCEKTFKARRSMLHHRKMIHEGGRLLKQKKRLASDENVVATSDLQMVISSENHVTSSQDMVALMSQSDCVNSDEILQQDSSTFARSPRDDDDIQLFTDPDSMDGDERSCDVEKLDITGQAFTPDAESTQELKSRRPTVFVCNFPGCQHKFKRPGQLHRHEERHAVPDEKMHHCDWPDCRKRFLYAQNMLSHRRQHVDPKPHHCNQCSLAYWQKSSLRSHQSKAHGWQSPTQLLQQSRGETRDTEITEVAATRDLAQTCVNSGTVDKLPDSAHKTMLSVGNSHEAASVAITSESEEKDSSSNFSAVIGESSNVVSSDRNVEATSYQREDTMVSAEETNDNVMKAINNAAVVSDGTQSKKSGKIPRRSKGKNKRKLIVAVDKMNVSLANELIPDTVVDSNIVLSAMTAVESDKAMSATGELADLTEDKDKTDTASSSSKILNVYEFCEEESVDVRQLSCRTGVSQLTHSNSRSNRQDTVESVNQPLEAVEQPVTPSDSKRGPKKRKLVKSKNDIENTTEFPAETSVNSEIKKNTAGCKGNKNDKQQVDSPVKVGYNKSDVVTVLKLEDPAVSERDCDKAKQKRITKKKATDETMELQLLPTARKRAATNAQLDDGRKVAEFSSKRRKTKSEKLSADSKSQSAHALMKKKDNKCTIIEEKSLTGKKTKTTSISTKVCKNAKRRTVAPIFAIVETRSKTRNMIAEAEKLLSVAFAEEQETKRGKKATAVVVEKMKGGKIKSAKSKTKDVKAVVEQLVMKPTKPGASSKLPKKRKGRKRRKRLGLKNGKSSSAKSHNAGTHWKKTKLLEIDEIKSNIADIKAVEMPENAEDTRSHPEQQSVEEDVDVKQNEACKTPDSESIDSVDRESIPEPEQDIAIGECNLINSAVPIEIHSEKEIDSDDTCSEINDDIDIMPAAPAAHHIDSEDDDVEEDSECRSPNPPSNSVDRSVGDFEQGKPNTSINQSPTIYQHDENDKPTSVSPSRSQPHSGEDDCSSMPELQAIDDHYTPPEQPHMDNFSGRMPAVETRSAISSSPVETATGIAVEETQTISAVPSDGAVSFVDMVQRAAMPDSAYPHTVESTGSEQNLQVGDRAGYHEISATSYPPGYPLLPVPSERRSLESHEGITPADNSNYMSSAGLPSGYFDTQSPASRSVAETTVSAYGMQLPSYSSIEQQSQLSRTPSYIPYGGSGTSRISESQIISEPTMYGRSMPPPPTFPSDAFAKDLFGQYFPESALPALASHATLQDQRGMGSMIGSYQQSLTSSHAETSSDLFRRAYSGIGDSFKPASMLAPQASPSAAPPSQYWMSTPSVDDRNRDRMSSPHVDSQSRVDVARHTYSSLRDRSDSTEIAGRMPKRVDVPPSMFASPAPPVSRSPAVFDRYPIHGSAYSLTYSPPTGGPAAYSSHGVPPPQSGADTSPRHLEDAYRQIADYRTLAAAHHRPSALPQAPDVYGSSSAAALSTLDRYYYSARDAMYRSQQLAAAAAMPHAFMPQSSVTPQYVDRTANYGRDAVSAYGQPAPSYSFGYHDNQYLATAGRTVKSTSASSEYFAASVDTASHVQDPYRHSVIYNMMPRYF